MTKLSFTEADTSAEYYIVEWSEMRIELQVSQVVKVESQSIHDLQVTEAQKAALREIDRLKAKSTYEAERARLKDLIIPKFNIKTPKIASGFTTSVARLT